MALKASIKAGSCSLAPSFWRFRSPGTKTGALEKNRTHPAFDQARVKKPSRLIRSSRSGLTSLRTRSSSSLFLMRKGQLRVMISCPGVMALSPKELKIAAWIWLPLSFRSTSASLPATPLWYITSRTSPLVAADHSPAIRFSAAPQGVFSGTREASLIVIFRRWAKTGPGKKPLPRMIQNSSIFWMCFIRSPTTVLCKRAYYFFIFPSMIILLNIGEIGEPHGLEISAFGYRPFRLLPDSFGSRRV